ncbi:hypothetical protein [Octadecabacter antarcticus]|uniref:hypothetical protein n=1 Tax=Octadecabacter antarcticus TaxID=1217908 RepID=UPI0005C657AA|nr:hypothetical protein [Octadecabacter antarcticus]
MGVRFRQLCFIPENPYDLTGCDTYAVSEVVAYGMRAAAGGRATGHLPNAIVAAYETYEVLQKKNVSPRAIHRALRDVLTEAVPPLQFKQSPFEDHESSMVSYAVRIAAGRLLDDQTRVSGTTAGLNDVLRRYGQVLTTWQSTH